MFKTFESGPIIDVDNVAAEYPGCMVLVDIKDCAENHGVLLALSDSVDTRDGLADYRISLAGDPKYSLLTAGSYQSLTCYFELLSKPWR